MATRNDKRKVIYEDGYWVVANDKFLSGFGFGRSKVVDRSMIAYFVQDYEEEKACTEMLENNPDMKNIRINLNLPRLRGNDDLQIVNWCELK